jgi:hypothetical protein
MASTFGSVRGQHEPRSALGTDEKPVSARVRRNEETALRKSGPERLGLGAFASRRLYQLGENVF